MKRILQDAVQIYGKDMQLDVAIEEMSELTKEIIKHKRGKENHLELAEEIADVHIMLDQVKIACDISDHEVNIFIQQKLQRLKNRLEDEKDGI